jgi:hypothetical protein
MTKRLTVALLCAAATFVSVGAATADAQVLTYRTAKELAKQLAEKQVRGRDVVSFHLLKPKRVNASRFVFLYDDRSADNVFCTARLIVSSTTRGRTTTVRARFAGQRCAAIPAAVLKFEAVTRRAQRDLRANTADTLDALAVVKRSTKRCRSLKVPRSRVRDAKALFDVALVEALERPNDAALGGFVDRLLSARVQNARLAAGAGAWEDYLAIVRSLPTVDDPCGALKAWKRSGFSASSAPIDFAGYRALARRADADQRVIVRAARLMAARGAFPNAAVGFTTDGMLEQLAVRAGITGGRKVVARALM